MPVPVSDLAWPKLGKAGLTRRSQVDGAAPPFGLEARQAGRRRAGRRGGIEARRDRVDPVQCAGEDEEVVQRQRRQGA